MDKKNQGGMNIGTSSVLVTFVLLCLVTFASLSYMSARSDYKLGQQEAERTAAYYDANRIGEIYMANIEGLLTKHCDKCSSKEEYLNGIEDVFADNINIDVERDGDDVLINYNVEISKSQSLDISLAAHYPTVQDGTLFHIKKWATLVDSEYVNSLKDDSLEGEGFDLMF